MKHATLFAVVLLATALLFSGCASPLGTTAQGPGPGGACDECAVAEVAPVGTPGGATAGAAAVGGQRASNQPNQSDPGARGIFTPISRGAGNQDVKVDTAEKRSQAGAPSVNQGLVIPNTASAIAGGSNPLLSGLESRARSYRRALDAELAKGDLANPDRIATLERSLDSLDEKMTRAIAAIPAPAPTIYNLQGARIVQSVANGSSSGEHAPIDAETARAVGEPLAKGVEATMAGPGDAAEVLRAASAAPPPPPLPVDGPPAGALPPIGEVK